MPKGTGINDDFLVVLTTPDIGTMRIAASRLKHIIPTALRLGINATLLDIESFTRLRLTGEVLNVGTGALRASVRVQPMEEGDDSGEVTVGAGVVYSRAHELGIPRSANIIIRPRRAKALRWFVDGQAVFARSVRMFLPKRPYFRPSIDEGVKNLTGHVGRELRRLIGEQGLSEE